VTQTLEWEVEGPAGSLTAIVDRADRPSGPRAAFVCAHGAGGHRADRSMTALASVLTGLDLVRFDFPYRQRGSGRPDPMPVLQQCVASVAERARAELQPDLLLIGGRSMGGRAASMLAADGFACDGVFLLAYPLHPAGRPEKLRDAHLSAIRVPVLCLNGTRDDLCRVELMQRALEGLHGRWTMHWLEGADHSFHVLKSSGRTDAEVMEEVRATAMEWLRGLGSR
jgi:uncharacterized protein